MALPGAVRGSQVRAESQVCDHLRACQTSSAPRRAEKGSAARQVGHRRPRWGPPREGETQQRRVCSRVAAAAATAWGHWRQ